MLGLAMLCWIGVELGAPGWYWFCWGTGVVIKIGELCWNMFKAGKEA